MGTHWSARFFAAETFDAPKAQLALTCMFDDVISEFSTWEDDSVISRINRAGSGSAVKVSEGFQTVWKRACQVIEASGGVFNPGLADWTTARSLLSDGKISRMPDDSLDLSAIAKGYAVDQMAVCLQALGLVSFLVEIGGEFVGCGQKPSGQPWWIELEKSRPQASTIRIALPGFGLATSAHRYQSEFTDTGFSTHISGETDDIHATVSVISRECMTADAWATALLAAGSGGMEMAEKNRLAAIFQAGSGEINLSSAAKIMSS